MSKRTKLASMPPSYTVEEVSTTDEEIEEQASFIQVDRAVPGVMLNNKCLLDTVFLPVVQEQPADVSAEARRVAAMKSTKTILKSRDGETPKITRRTRPRVCSCVLTRLCSTCVRIHALPLHSSEVVPGEGAEYDNLPFTRVLRTTMSIKDDIMQRVQLASHTLNFANALMNHITMQTLLDEHKPELVVFSRDVKFMFNQPFILDLVSHAQVSIRLMQNGFWFGCYRIIDIDFPGYPANLIMKVNNDIAYVIDIRSSFRGDLLQLESDEVAETPDPPSLFERNETVGFDATDFGDFPQVHGGGLDSSS
jgi:hypothetical protein